jgi:hypothetical protein
MLINSPRHRPSRSAVSANRTDSQAQRYLHDLLSDVAGKELHRAGVQAKVRCQTGERPYSIEDRTIVVDPSLLKVLTTKEEVAFLLAQQAALIMTGSNPSGLQFGADQMAFDMMADANMNPVGGYSALEKLYKNYPTEAHGDGMVRVARTVASGQEHEGIRMGVAQVELERRRRSGEPSTDLPLTPLPHLGTVGLAQRNSEPSLRPESGLDLTLERAFARLEGKPHQVRLEGLLETLVAATKKGALGKGPISQEKSQKLQSVFEDSSKPEDGHQPLHSRFLSTLMGSESLREVLHPLGKPWQTFLSNLVEKRGRFGLPEGLLVLNQMAGADMDAEIPPKLGRVREEIAHEHLRPPYKKPQELGSFLHELYRSQEWAPFSEEFQQHLPHLLLDIVRTSDLDPNFQHTTGEPNALHPEMESDLLDLLTSEKTQTQDRKAITNFLALHHDTDHAWSRDSLSQRKLQAILPGAEESLAQGFPKVPHPDFSDITELEKENFANPKEFRRAQRRQKKVNFEQGRRLRLAAARQAQSVLVPLTAVGSDEKALERFTNSVDAPHYESLLSSAEAALVQGQTWNGLAGSESETEHVSVQAGQTMMKGWLAVQDQVKDLEHWHDITRRTVDFCSPILELEGCRETLGAALSQRMEALQPQQKQEWLRKPYVSHLLSSENLQHILADEIDGQHVDRAELARRVDSIDREFQLSARRPTLYSKLRNQVSQEARLQPQEIDSVFPPDTRNQVEVAQGLAAPLSGLSGLLALTREQPTKVQLKTIEYLMSQTKECPAFLEKLDEHQGFLPMHAVLRQARVQLKEADPGIRLMVANSFLTGPSGLLRKDGGREILLGHFLRDVNEKERALVSRLAQSVLQAQGEADSLAVAALLSQKPENGRPTTEAEMLSSFFDAYGVPGIKMKQYFAFTTKDVDHREAFASAQDNAKPVSHYQALRLLKDRFGGQWPTHLKVEKVLGNGSVNVAVKLLNKETGKIEIASVNRRDIQEATEYDFARFQQLFQTLTQTPEDREEFGFVLGLMKIVKDSVDLEFDRPASLEIQKTAFETYDHTYDGWHVRSIDAFRAENQSLFMEQAKGVTARKLKSSHPDLYKKTMTAMHKAEMSVLRGQQEQGDVLPRALFANPDFHDGQVLIDTDTKEVTILDFGQAVRISVKERKAALDLLTVFGKGDSAKKAAKRLNKRFFNSKKVLSKEKLEPILARKELMGRFIHLLSLISREGGEVPLASVNWILALNRQISLGKALDQPVERQVKTMVASHKLGVGLGTANSLNAIGRSLTGLGAGMTGWCCGGAVRF